MASPEYLRYYDDTIVQLAARGHDVVVAVNAVREGKPVRLSAIEGVDARVSVSGLIPERDDVWTPLARAVRGTMDFVRYLHPQLAGASALRARVKRQALPWPLAPLDRPRVLGANTVARRMERLARLERAIPVSRRVGAFLDRHAPDLVLVSPLVEPASDQVDLVRAAQARGIRVATLVASWDNLTNKGDLRVATGRVVVWNERQKREAVELHRVDPATVVVTGSQVFDRWFDRRPSIDRQAFCRQVGLPDDRPFVLYTGSSIFIARAEREMPFVRRWIETLRASDDAAVRRLGVLVRPHPYNGRAWDPSVFDDLQGVAVWPRGGYDPIDARNRDGFFDSMFHAEAVVGINTSAMIEAAIVGRPVLSMTTPEFAATQGSTLHFRHLLPENGGFLRTAGSLDEHVAQLAGVLRDPAVVRGELRSFVHAFVRPHGLDRPATPRLVDAIEEYGRTTAPAPVLPDAADRMLTAALWPLALVARFFPPEAGRKRGIRRRLRERVGRLRRDGRDLVHEGVGPARVATRSLAASAPAAGRMLAGAARACVVRPLKQLRRTGRHARYHAAMWARRMRGVPLC